MVDYTFLSELDLLRDARQDVSQRLWATPTGRLAMDMWYRMCRAEEEIKRCNIEIRRVATHLRDEDRYLEACERQVRLFDEPLAHQIAIRRANHTRFSQLHRKRLVEISKMKGFNGTIKPGRSLNNGHGESSSIPVISPPQVSPPNPPSIPQLQSTPRSPSPMEVEPSDLSRAPVDLREGGESDSEDEQETEEGPTRPDEEDDEEEKLLDEEEQEDQEDEEISDAFCAVMRISDNRNLD